MMAGMTPNKYMVPPLENESLPATIDVYTGAVDSQIAIPIF